MTLEAKGLTVSATLGGRTVDVLRDLNFTVGPGKVLGLVGESGAGKSMVGRILSQTLPAGFAVTAGSLDFDGHDLVRQSPAALRALLGDRIAFIPQEPLSALNPLQTVGTQFGEHLARLGVAHRERRARILAALAEVRLDAPDRLLERYPFQLSGGMCQRVLIAMAFAGRPALVIADEPTTALDVATQATIAGIVRRMQREHGTSLVFITHDLRLAARVADEILVLYAGDAVECGPARTILEAPRHPYTRALSAANPPLKGPWVRLPTLPDQMPGIAALPDLKGCRFAPRCPTSNALCAGSLPPLREIAPGHTVRCVPACESTAAVAAPAPRAAMSFQSGAPILDVRAVSKTYPGRRDWLGRREAVNVAVACVDVAVRPAEFVGVVGESGSGKSTLARLIMGLERPTSGQIELDGHNVTRADPAARLIRLDALQMVFQDPQSALNPRRPVERIVTQALEARRRPTTSNAERYSRARALLTETGLPSELIDRYPAQLSGGQKQRVNIARALCVTPRLLVADEIVSGLDVSVQAQILNLLLDLRESRGIAMIFISHDLTVVRYLCSRLIVMYQGAVVESGATETIFATPAHPYTQRLLAAVPPDDLNTPWPPEQT